MTNKKIFVACDASSLKEIKKIINDTKTNKLQIIPAAPDFFIRPACFNTNCSTVLV